MDKANGKKIAVSLFCIGAFFFLGYMLAEKDTIMGSVWVLGGFCALALREAEKFLKEGVDLGNI